jgi:type II secretory pathway predicted ATPase ExeA
MVRDGSPAAVNPFDGSLAAGDFFVGLPQEEALARLQWLVDERQRLGIVVGPSGCGKSHLAAMAVRRLGGSGAEAALLSLKGLAEGDWLPMLLDRLPLDPLSAAEPFRPWQKLENRLRENTLMERPTAVVFDDLDQAPADAVAGIERLVSSAEPRFSRLLIVGTIDGDGLGRLPAGLLAQAAVRIDLSAWSGSEISAFLAWSLERTGRDPDLFSEPAAATLARLTSGVPRQVCQLARLAVVAADAEMRSSIDAALVERVWRELVPAAVAARVTPVPAVRDAADASGIDAASENDPDAAGERRRFRVVRRLWG